MNKIIIALDDGHGMETAGKRTPIFEDGTFMKENEFNFAVVNYLDIELKRCGFYTLLVADGDSDVPLITRTSVANNIITNKYNRQADLYISVHANANTGNFGNWGGVETYVYTYADNFTEEIGNIIHKNLIKGTPLKDRGVKRANFHVLRETVMPAVLVECGFMDNREEARLLMSETYRKECATEIAQAICEIYGVDYIKIKEEKEMTTIKGQAIATVKQMVQYTLRGNPKPQLPYCTVNQLANIFIEEGAIEGIRGDIAYAQSLKETGYFRYGGIITSQMNNFSGIGALNNNKNGQACTFKTPREGVRGQIQHLKAYATDEDLNQICIDPRFKLVKRNSAPYVEWLGAEDNPNKTGWAYPGNGYGTDIVNILKAILKEPIVEVKPPTPKWQLDSFEVLKDKEIIKDASYWDRLDENIKIGECMALLVAVIHNI